MKKVMPLNVAGAYHSRLMEPARAAFSAFLAPIAFAAPGKPGEPFLLDMATTTVAAGKIRNKANEKLQAPPGWLVTAEGKPSTDPHEVSKGGFMTPLGGTPEAGILGTRIVTTTLNAALANGMLTDPKAMEKDYIPESPDIIAHTKLIQPGQTGSVEVTLEPGEYPYLCTFPGHSMVMKGVMHVK